MAVRKALGAVHGEAKEMRESTEATVQRLRALQGSVESKAMQASQEVPKLSCTVPKAPPAAVLSQRRSDWSLVGRVGLGLWHRHRGRRRVTRSCPLCRCATCLRRS
jgi:hypothetical protein